MERTVAFLGSIVFPPLRALLNPNGSENRVEGSNARAYGSSVWASKGVLKEVHLFHDVSHSERTGSHASESLAPLDSMASRAEYL